MKPGRTDEQRRKNLGPSEQLRRAVVAVWLFLTLCVSAVPGVVSAEPAYTEQRDLKYIPADDKAQPAQQAQQCDLFIPVRRRPISRGPGGAWRRLG